MIPRSLKRSINSRRELIKRIDFFRLPGPSAKHLKLWNNWNRVTREAQSCFLSDMFCRIGKWITLGNTFLYSEWFQLGEKNHKNSLRNWIKTPIIKLSSFRKNLSNCVK